MALQHRQRLQGAAVVGQRRARGHHRRVVARHIGHHQGVHRCCTARLRQTAAFDAGQVAAHHVHVADVSAAAQQGHVHGSQLRHRQTFGRQGDQGRATARHQGQHQIVRPHLSGHGEHLFGCIRSGLIGHRVARLHNLDALAAFPVAITRDHQPRQRPVPRRLHGSGHAGRGFARTQNQGTPLGTRWQKRRHALQGIHSGQRRVKQRPQQHAWCHLNRIGFGQGTHDITPSASSICQGWRGSLR